MRDRKTIPWSTVVALARRANDHYSMTERQQELLYELALTIPDNGTIVELGVCHGKTAIVLAIAAAHTDSRYVGIDNWSLESSEEEVLQHLDEVGGELPNEWHLDWGLINACSWASETAEGISKIDFLVIDAGHDEENVSKDCALWIPLVKPGGIVVFDDWPSGPRWWESCHAAIRKHAEVWCAEWEWAASYGKTVAFRKPLTT